MAEDVARTWIAAQDPARHADLTALHEAIRRALPHLTVKAAGSMLVYGPFRYRYATGREGDTALVSMASGKTGISVYVNSAEPDGQYVAEKAAPRLGKKAKVGKSCIRVKKAADVDLAVLDEVLKRALAVGGAGAVDPPG
jgi:hypothetical protein